MVDLYKDKKAIKIKMTFRIKFQIDGRIQKNSSTHEERLFIVIRYDNNLLKFITN